MHNTINFIIINNNNNISAAANIKKNKPQEKNPIDNLYYSLYNHC